MLSKTFGGSISSYDRDNSIGRHGKALISLSEIVDSERRNRAHSPEFVKSIGKMWEKRFV